MKKHLICVAILIICFGTFSAALAETPRVVQSFPENGAAGVPLDVGRISIVFNVNMKMNSWSLVTAKGLPFPPMIRQEEPWLDPLTFELKIKPLNPGTTYAVGLNSTKRKGYQSAEGQAALPPTVITFTTAANGPEPTSPPAPVLSNQPGPTPFPPPNIQAKQMPPSPPPLVTDPARSEVDRPGMRPGWRFEVTRSSGVKGNFYPQGMAPIPLQYFLQVKFAEEVMGVEGKRITAVRRDVTKAELQGYDPEIDRAVRNDLVQPGQQFRVAFSPAGAMLTDARSGQEVWDEDLVAIFATPPAPNLWPDGPLTQGQRWSYSGADLNRRLGLIEARGGRLDLSVEKIEPETGSGLMTAFIRGRLQTTIDFDPVPLAFDARVEIDLPLAVGIPFMVKFDGTVSGKGTTQDNAGRPLPFTVKGEGTLLQISKPSQKVFAAVGGAAPGSSAAPAEPPAYPPQGKAIPPGAGGQESLYGRPPLPQTPRDAYGQNTPAQSLRASLDSRANKGKSVFLGLYREQYQGAFYMLVPKGWRTEGGMIPSGVQWNVVDLVENNIQFRATSPDGKSFFGWYPRFYFQDPSISARSSGGHIRKQPGEVLSGCWLYAYMSLEDYVRVIVLGQFGAKEFQNARLLGPAVASPELKPFVPQSASRYQCGYVNFACSINGVPSIGRIYAIIYDIHGVLWSTVGTFGWVAPQSRRQEDERIMEMCIRSFRLDPKWARRAAEGARHRAKGYNKVIQDMQRIDAEMNRNRAQTRSDIQEEFYKVITDQIETRDPRTGQVKYLPMYNHAYTDGQGNYILKDGDDGTLPVEDASRWRRLQVVNRNDPGYRPAN